MIYLSMGELLIDYLSTNREKFDKKLVDSTLNLIKRKQMISDELALEALSSAIQKYEKWQDVRAFLVAGYPRTLQQAMDWDKYVKAKLNANYKLLVI
jgi:adenylate kinase family enzyme